MSEQATAPSTAQEQPAAAPAPAPSGPSTSGRRRIEYYKEENNFEKVDFSRQAHLGWGAIIGTGAIFFCMGMSGATQSRSWNVSFRWLQRRVGFQFGTLSYIVTTNLLYYHDGDKWVTRNWSKIMERWASKRKDQQAVATA